MKYTGIATQSLIVLITFLFFTTDGSAKNLANTQTPVDYRYSLSLYGGVHASDTLDDMITFDATYSNDNKVLVVSLAKEIYHYKNSFSIEVEGQIGKLVGDDTGIWEYVGLGMARWQAFPWDDLLDTSLAIGAGFSYYSDISQIEKSRNEEAQQFLGYLTLELTFEIPGVPDWDLLLRIHHRSGMGTIIGKGSSNYPCIGLKYTF